MCLLYLLELSLKHGTKLCRQVMLQCISVPAQRKIFAGLRFFQIWCSLWLVSVPFRAIHP